MRLVILTLLLGSSAAWCARPDLAHAEAKALAHVREAGGEIMRDAKATGHPVYAIFVHGAGANDKLVSRLSAFRHLRPRLGSKAPGSPTAVSLPCARPRA